MGYTTWFDGELIADKEMKKDFVDYINKFANVRHMKRNNATIKKLFPNWKELCYKGNLGKDGEYFIGGMGNFGQTIDSSIMDNNRPSNTQPGLWCQWIIKENSLVWDEGEKFYHYIEWLEYLISNFFNPAGYMLNGEISWEGEDEDDIGKIIVTNNEIEII